MKLFLLAITLCWSLFFSHHQTHSSIDLIAHYRLDGNAQNQTKHLDDGKILGPTHIQDRFGNEQKAMHFDGMDDFIHIPVPDPIYMTEITVSAWIKLDRDIQYEQARIVCQQQRPSTQSWGLEIFGNYYASGAGNQLHFHANTGESANNILSERKLFPNTWYHVAGVNDGKHLYLYINGELDRKIPSKGYLYPNIAADIVIGKTQPPATFFFPGTIDELKIFKKGLSSKQIQEIYAHSAW